MVLLLHPEPVHECSTVSYPMGSSARETVARCLNPFPTVDRVIEVVSRSGAPLNRPTVVAVDVSAKTRKKGDVGEEPNSHPGGGPSEV